MSVSRCVPWILFLLLAFAAPQGASTQERVILDETGIAGRFVNPVSPIRIGDEGLQFVNNTGDRTFVVTIPFVYSAEEAGRAFAIADYERGRQVVSDIVCDVLPGNCPEDLERAISQLEGLRVLLEAVSQAKPVSLKTDCTPGDLKVHLKNGSCIAEFLFWTATQEEPSLPDFARFSSPKDDIREAVETRAMLLLDDFFISNTTFPSEESWRKAQASQEAITALLSPATLKKEDEEFDKAYRKGSSSTTDTSREVAADPFSYEIKGLGLAARFGEARIDIAKKALVSAIRMKMGFPRDQNAEEGNAFSRMLRRVGIGSTPKTEEKKFTKPIQDVFKALNDYHAALAKQERSPNADKAVLACKRLEVEAAAKLLASYSPDSTVPYTGVPETIKDNKQGKKECEDLSREVPEEQQAGFSRRMKAASRAEEGIEITDCEADGSSTKCSARATIRPYGRATFSGSILAHHPEPRIRFTVSFFGDTEVPANANGYVTRGDAKDEDEKPKSAFVLQFGGDTSTSLEPKVKEPDPFTGQLRHTGATGELSFQYSGQVEASATIQYTTGDFGEVSANPDSPSSEIQATQYQAKVYGPQGVVLQYGKVPFAKPSSGIAVNVSGEGVQLITRWANLAYVVLRESGEGQPDIKDQDSDLLLLQVRNLPLGAEGLRTVDLVGLYGEDRKGNPDVLPRRPYHYLTGGFEARWGTKRFPSLGGSFALYHSIRRFSSAHPLDPASAPRESKDGKGAVGLFRTSWTHIPDLDLENLQEEVRPAFGISAILGYGTGDNEDDTDKDDGYLGENAGYANDVLFLSSIAAAHSQSIGKGLSNKEYLGLQLTSWRLSPLAWISRLFGAEKDIESRSTILTLHGYRFNEEVQGLHWAGEEVDIEFNLEAPKNIQWVLSGAYYRRSDAIEKSIGLEEDLWSATARLSIKLDSI